MTDSGAKCSSTSNGLGDAKLDEEEVIAGGRRASSSCMAPFRPDQVSTAVPVTHAPARTARTKAWSRIAISSLSAPRAATTLLCVCFCMHALHAYLRSHSEGRWQARGRGGARCWRRSSRRPGRGRTGRTRTWHIQHRLRIREPTPSTQANVGSWRKLYCSRMVPLTLDCNSSHGQPPGPFANLAADRKSSDKQNQLPQAVGGFAASIDRVIQRKGEREKEEYMAQHGGYRGGTRARVHTDPHPSSRIRYYLRMQYER
ncbi:hypothetical protein C8R47DRAFT_1162207 [Mycena vitilis]|nr:hypothetical protein C8R47DRAFT_1162207 [Mycena vitilis]